MCFWQEISHPPETRFNHTRCGESNKMQLYLLCCGGCRGERNIWFTFNFEIMYSGSEVSMAHSESTMSLINLRHFSSGPLGVMWPTFRTTALQWLQVNWMWTVTTGFGKTADDKHKDLFIQKWCCNAQSACCRTFWNMALKHFESLEWSRLFLNNFCRGHPVVFCLQYMDFFIQSDTTYFLKAMPNLVFLNNFVMTFVCWPSYVNVAPSCFWFCLCIESFFFFEFVFLFLHLFRDDSI